MKKQEVKGNYFKNPFIISCSACFSSSPSVISFINCSPAILPIVASCTKFASTLFAIIDGIAITFALSFIIASHSTCPKHFEFPSTCDSNCCTEFSVATDLDVTFVLEFYPFISTLKDVFAV